MKILLALLTALALLPARGLPEDEPPACTVSLTLPESALDLRLEYRQVGPDLSRFREPSSATGMEVQKLRVLSHLAQGSSLSSDVWLTVGDVTLRPGRHPLGFTLGADEAMHLFIVDGTQAFPITGEIRAAAFESPLLSMQLLYVSRDEARLLWTWKRSAGSIRLGLGTQESAAAPAPASATAPASAPAPDAAGAAGSTAPTGR